jgi:two-component system invasion response regulator UvrY
MPSILVIDDNLLARQGLVNLLESEFGTVFVGQAKDRLEALPELAGRKWDLVVLDFSDPKREGLVLLGHVRKLQPSAQCLVLTGRSHAREAARVRQMGACGYASKDGARAELSRAIRDLLAGKKHFASSDAHGDPSIPSPPGKGLSPQEYRVMLALAGGRRATDIAAEFNLSVKTVSTYKRRILDKLHLDSVVDLVRYVIENQLS